MLAPSVKSTSSLVVSIHRQIGLVFLALSPTTRLIMLNTPIPLSLAAVIFFKETSTSEVSKKAVSVADE